MHNQYLTRRDRPAPDPIDRCGSAADRPCPEPADHEPGHAPFVADPVTRPGLTGRVVPLPDGRPPVVLVLPRPLAAVLPHSDGARTSRESSGLTPAVAGSPATAEMTPAPTAGPPDAQTRSLHEVTAATRWLVPRLVEVLRGHRPASQLADRLAPFPYADLLRRTRLLARAGDDPGPAGLRSVHCQQVRPGAVEVAVHLQVPQRSSVALALRWERHRRNWLCTVLDFGPHSFTLRAPVAQGVTRTAERH